MGEFMNASCNAPDALHQILIAVQTAPFSSRIHRIDSFTFLERGDNQFILSAACQIHSSRALHRRASVSDLFNRCCRPESGLFAGVFNPVSRYYVSLLFGPFPFLQASQVNRSTRVSSRYVLRAMNNSSWGRQGFPKYRRSRIPWRREKLAREPAYREGCRSSEQRHWRCSSSHRGISNLSQRNFGRHLFASPSPSILFRSYSQILRHAWVGTSSVTLGCDQGAFEARWRGRCRRVLHAAWAAVKRAGRAPAHHLEDVLSRRRSFGAGCHWC